MKAICCMGIDGAIGANTPSGLPWKFPEDLKRFKQKTTNKLLIVGSKTAEKLPTLGDRQLAVVSRTQKVLENNPNYIWVQPSRHHCTFANHRDIWVIGGNQTWELYSTYITEWHITRIFKTFSNATEVFNFSLLDGFRCEEIYDHTTEQFRATTECWRPKAVL